MAWWLLFAFTTGDIEQLGHYRTAADCAEWRDALSTQGIDAICIWSDR
jgi:hypothetical protein